MIEQAVLVLRADDGFSSKLREAGFEVVNLELIKTESVDDLSEFHSKLLVIGRFDGLFFTSPVAATIFLKELYTSGSPFSGKIYVLGERTKRVFENSGMNVEYRSDVDSADELIAAFGESEFAGKRLLFVRGNKSMRTIRTLLANSAEVEEVVVYRTLFNEFDAGVIDRIRGQLRRDEIGWACFFSPSGVERFCELFDPEDRSSIRSATIGRTTALSAEASGLKVHFISPRAGAEDFAAGLIEHIKEH